MLSEANRNCKYHEATENVKYEPRIMQKKALLLNSPFAALGRRTVCNRHLKFNWQQKSPKTNTKQYEAKKLTRTKIFLHSYAAQLSVPGAGVL